MFQKTINMRVKYQEDGIFIDEVHSFPAIPREGDYICLSSNFNKRARVKEVIWASSMHFSSACGAGVTLVLHDVYSSDYE